MGLQILQGERMNNDLERFEQWKKIPIDGLMYDYRISTLGRVVKVLPNGKRLLLKHTYDRKACHYTVCLKLKNGLIAHKTITSLMGLTFLEPKEGYVFTTKNNIQTDMRLSNITQMKTKDVMTRTNKGKRKTIFKIDKQGNVVAIYKSTRECAFANNYSQQSISDRCAGIRKNILASDGYAYCYEDNEKYLGKILKELRENAQGDLIN